MAPPPRYTPEQITAVVAAVLDEGITQAEARRRAQAGTLAAGLDPFTISKDASSRYVLKAELNRAKTQAEADPRNAANNFARSVLVALEPSNQALLAKVRAGRHNEAQLRERARTLREYVSLQGSSERKTISKKPDPTQPQPADLASLLNAEDTEHPQDTTPARVGARSSARELAPAHA